MGLSTPIADRAAGAILKNAVQFNERQAAQHRLEPTAQSAAAQPHR